VQGSCGKLGIESPQFPSRARAVEPETASGKAGNSSVEGCETG
jgi:hypothetical protein